MTTPPSLPILPGLGWSRHKSPKFNTRVAGHVSGREVRVPLQQVPLYEFEATYNGLTNSSSSIYNGIGAQSLQSLMGFFLQLQGQFATFLYPDPDDNSVSSGAVGTGNGSTQVWLLQRNLGGFTEPVSWVTALTNVYFNGVPQSSATYELIAPNTLAFYNAPGNGIVITADFTFAYQCRFLDDRMDFEEFMSSLWKLDSMKFRSIKANTTTAAAPPWYVPYEIGGVAPSIFADYTTEGGLDHYLFNGTIYAGSALFFTGAGYAFARTSVATYWNASGDLASASTGVLRFDYNPSTLAPKGILLEGASTNLLLQSNNFGTSWSALVGSQSQSQNVTGPDGVNNSGWTIMAGSGALAGYYQGDTSGSTKFAAGTTLSIFAKAGTGAWAFTIAQDDSSDGVCTSFDLAGGGTVGGTSIAVDTAPASLSLTHAQIEAVQGGWYRAQATTAGAGSEFLMFGGADANKTIAGNGYPPLANTHTAEFYGAQAEALPFASSYIPTTTGTASRVADSLTRTRTSPTSLTKLIAGFTPPGVGTEQDAWYVSDGTTANNIHVAYKSDGHLHVIVVSGSTTQADLDMGAVAVNTAFGLAFAATAGNFAASLSGGAVVSVGSGTMPSGMTSERLGGGVNAGNEWFSDIELDAEWTGLVATSTQLQAVSQFAP
jgi:hypothetical protein